MFKIATDPKFTHVVTVMVPVDGGHEAQTFRATFRVIDVDDIGDTMSLDGQKDLLRRILCDFLDVEGEDGNPAVFNDALRDRLIAVPYVRGALIQTYIAAIIKAKAGN